MRKAIVLAVFLLAITCSPALAKADISYLQNVAQRSVQITFNGGLDGVCLWGETPALGKTTIAVHDPDTEMSTCRLDGLEPGTLYYYNTVANDKLISGSFTTAPDRDNTFNFVVIGDTRTDHVGHQSVIDGILQYNPSGYPDLFFNVGDMVGDGGDKDQWGEFFTTELEILSNTIFIPIIGNHETVSKHTWFDSLFVQQRHYWFKYGNSLFIIMDTEGRYGPNNEQYQMVADALEQAEADPEIVFKFVSTNRESPAAVTAPTGPSSSTTSTCSRNTTLMSSLTATTTSMNMDTSTEFTTW
ncbi:MAG: metallophosphoesterase [Candidatus Alcyoniella australis]|nr:metallophosphoesterase [Candidatus Alcyoniella australis]